MATRFGDERDWFLEKRFGLFIHWGIYAIPGWQEQHQWRGRMPANEYVKLAEQWDPTNFNPDAWLDLAEEAGMQYIIGPQPNTTMDSAYGIPLTRHSTQ